MKLLEFRITNFRSIVDTGWSRFSPDGTTVFVGQNESGKTSILEALAKSLSTSNIEENDIRHGSPLPEIHLRLSMSPEEFDDGFEFAFEKYQSEQIAVARRYVYEKNWTVTLRCYWSPPPKSGESYVGMFSLDDPALDRLLEESALPLTTPTPDDASAGKSQSKTAKTELTLTAAGLARHLYQESPLTVLFQSDKTLLPDKIDIEGDFTLKGDGAAGASNYLKAASLDLNELMKADLRSRSSSLKRANQLITRNFRTFWNQTIGREIKLDLECSIEIYGAENSEKVGKPYLVFWISDGLNKLYPRQRSQGVRWFVSFYLQMMATGRADTNQIFLLDEPGAHLHPRAQEDVLRLINHLCKSVPIIYSTHSPHMIEYDKLYRVYGVQREGDMDDSPTKIIDANSLGSASTDTLSPVLTIMGVDLSHQQVIKKSDNVLLEEISGYYYLKAFWQLTKEGTVAHFLAASGASKIETLANLFIGWGLDFGIALDDDNHGRTSFNSMKRNLFGDDEERAGKRMLKLKPFKGIEDVFSKEDFFGLVLREPAIAEHLSNSDFMKTNGRSKPVAAFQFLGRVRDGEIKFDDLSAETRANIADVKDRIVKMLKTHKDR